MAYLSTMCHPPLHTVQCTSSPPCHSREEPWNKAAFKVKTRHEEELLVSLVATPVALQHTSPFWAKIKCTRSFLHFAGYSWKDCSGMGKAQSKEYIQCEKMQYDHCTPHSFLLQMYYSHFAIYNYTLTTNAFSPFCQLACACVPRSCAHFPFAPLQTPDWRSAAMSASEFAKACTRTSAISFFLT